MSGGAEDVAKLLARVAAAERVAQDAQRAAQDERLQREAAQRAAQGERQQREAAERTARAATRIASAAERRAEAAEAQVRDSAVESVRVQLANADVGSPPRSPLRREDAPSREVQATFTAFRKAFAQQQSGTALSVDHYEPHARAAGTRLNLDLDGDDMSDAASFLNAVRRKFPAVARMYVLPRRAAGGGSGRQAVWTSSTGWSIVYMRAFLDWTATGELRSEPAHVLLMCGEDKSPDGSPTKAPEVDDEARTDALFGALAARATERRESSVAGDAARETTTLGELGDSFALVHRDEELAAVLLHVQTQWEQVQAAQGQDWSMVSQRVLRELKPAALCGMPGLGKSRLARDCLADAVRFASSETAGGDAAVSSARQGAWANIHGDVQSAIESCVGARHQLVAHALRVVSTDGVLSLETLLRGAVGDQLRLPGYVRRNDWDRFFFEWHGRVGEMHLLHIVLDEVQDVEATALSRAVRRLFGAAMHASGESKAVPVFVSVAGTSKVHLREVDSASQAQWLDVPLRPLKAHHYATILSRTVAEAVGGSDDTATWTVSEHSALDSLLSLVEGAPRIMLCVLHAIYRVCGTVASQTPIVQKSTLSFSVNVATLAGLLRDDAALRGMYRSICAELVQLVRTYTYIPALVSVLPQLDPYALMSLIGHSLFEHPIAYDSVVFSKAGEDWTAIMVLSAGLAYAVPTDSDGVCVLKLPLIFVMTLRRMSAQSSIGDLADILSPQKAHPLLSSQNEFNDLRALLLRLAFLQSRGVTSCTVADLMGYSEGDDLVTNEC